MATSGESNSPPPTIKLNEKVLLQCWARLSVYDQTATGLKNKFIQRRNWVIGLTLTATIASVLTGILGQTTLAVILAMVSIALPIVSAFLMNDIIAFTGKTAWIKYRYIAEMMRMHIYLYRLQAGEYASGPLENMDTRLSNNLEQLVKDVSLDEAIPLLGQEPTDRDQIIASINEANKYTKGDDGLSAIADADKYIEWRVDNQRNWYKSKIDTDFARLKYFSRVAQAFLGVGALVSAVAGVSVNIQLVTLVAVTNAISVALKQWSDVSMIGKTHSIFQIAWDQLGNQKRNWSSIEDDIAREPATQGAQFATFAGSIENILLWERQEWYEMALQTEANSDKSILGDLTKLNERAEAAKYNKS